MKNYETKIKMLVRRCRYLKHQSLREATQVKASQCYWALLPDTHHEKLVGKMRYRDDGLVKIPMRCYRFDLCFK